MEKRTTCLCKVCFDSLPEKNQAVMIEVASKVIEFFEDIKVK